MKFRPIQALLIVAMAAGLISACQEQAIPPTATIEPTRAGGTPSAEVDGTSTPARAEARPTSTTTPVHSLDVEFSNLRGEVITFWHPWQGELARQVQLAADEFNRSNEWGLKVQATAHYSTGALYDTVNEARGMERSVTGTAKTPAPVGAAGPAGRLDPDLVAATSDQLATWASENDPIVIDLMPYINDPQSGLSEVEIAAYTPGFWKQDSSGDLQFGLPALRNAQILFYNQSWANDLGFNQPPKTAVDFKRQACAAAVANNTAKVLDLYGTGGWIVDTDPLTTMSWLAVFGANPLPESEGQAYRFESKEANEALGFLRGLIDDGCAWQGREQQSPYEMFASRKALFYSGSLVDIQMQIRWQEQLQSQDSWMVLPFPGNNGEPVVFSGGYSYGVLKSTPEAQLGAWLFARYLSRPEVAIKLVEALPSLPVTSKINEQLSGMSERSPWNQIMRLTENLRPAPGFASWRQARRPLEDAAWQVYHLPPDGLIQILPQLDITVKELLKE